jgi:hypothetical protein
MLERTIRRIKASAFSVLILAAALFGIYATRPVPQTITAHEFKVVDSAGRIRGVFGISRVGGLAIDLRTVDGDTSVTMGVRSSGEPYVELDDGASTTILSLSIHKSGGAEVALIGGKGSLHMATLASGEPVFDLVGGHGDAVIGVSSDGFPAFMLDDQHRTTRTSVGVHGITFSDRAGRQRAVMGVSKEGLPLLDFIDPEGFELDLGSTSMGNEATGEKQQTSAASIVMSGKDHHVIWRAP